MKLINNYLTELIIYKLSKITLIILLLPLMLNSQEIISNVSVNSEFVPFEEKQYISTLETDLENYINNQKFLETEWEGKPISVDINIVLNSIGNHRFSARIAFVTRRDLDLPNSGESLQIPMLRIVETNWTFEYNLGANLTYNLLRFDRICSMIDFYILLAIGFDLDSYGELGGSDVFEKAKSIVQLGASLNIEGFQTYSEPGEFTKYNLIRELTDPRFFELRRIFFTYFSDGFDSLAFNREEGLKNIIHSLKLMYEFKKNKLVESSILLQTFFNSQSQTLATLFNGYPDTEIFDILMYLDPSNGMLYRDSKEGKLK